MSQVRTWSTTPASNNSSPPDGAPEGQTAASLNNVIRQIMAELAVLYSWEHPTTISTGTDTIVLTLSVAPTSYTSGMRFSFYKNGSDNTGAVTLNVNSLGAKAVVKRDGSTALSAADLKANASYEVEYDGTSFRVLSLGIG